MVKETKNGVQKYEKGALTYQKTRYIWEKFIVPSEKYKFSNW